MHKTKFTLLFILMLLLSGGFLHAKKAKKKTKVIKNEIAEEIHIPEAQEHIIKFHSDIYIDTLGHIDVTETIKVLVTGANIKRGIRRTIPIYRDNKKSVIEIDSVLRNSVKEPYETTINKPYLDILIANKDSILNTGIHTYTIKYRTDNRINFTDTYDEFTWDVNGKMWTFDIDSISATLHLPKGASIIDNSCLITDTDWAVRYCNYRLVGDSIIEYFSHSLRPNENLTISLRITPNVVHQPLLSKFDAYMQAHSIPLITIVACVLIFVYLVFSLCLIKSMDEPTIPILSFAPPRDMSVGELRHIYTRKSDYKSAEAILLSMALKKAILIKHINNKYVLTSLGNTKDLTNEELRIYKALFTHDGMDVCLEKNNKYVDIIKSNLNNQTTSTLTSLYSNSNKLNTLFGYLSIATYVIWLALFYCYNGYNNETLILFLSPFYTSLLIISQKDKLVTTSCWVFISILGVALLVPKFPPIFHNSNFITFFLALAFCLFEKYAVIKTREGRQMTNEIEGFKLYLTYIDVNKHNYIQPDMPAKEFEKMLPYAVVLNCERKWSKKFTYLISNTSYQPTWFLGNSTSYYKVIRKILKDWKPLFNK